MVKLTIDGIQVEAEKGTSILHAAESVGIEVPTLCYIKDLLPDGSCRMCMVEIESRGRTKMETACTAQVAEGLVGAPLKCPVCAHPQSYFELKKINY